ncbi:MAG: CpsD/CapB family tyrosine-protein kinase [bacterium]|nr:CpsD/CapB family tyrosine-protein kinase [bacterium]
MGPEANENYRKTALTLYRALPEKGPGVFAFSGIDRGAGCSTVVLNVARHLKEGCGLSPLIVELNTVRPVLASILGLDARRGITTIAGNELTPAECVQTGEFGVAVIPAQRHNPRESLEPNLGSVLSSIVDQLGAEYQVILVDTPSVLQAAGALAIAAGVEGLVLVVEAGRTRAEMLERARLELNQAGVTLLGCVLNKHKRFIPGWAYWAFVK